MPIRAVVFDIGETIIDESRIWREWADWLGAPHAVFFAAMGALIQQGDHHVRVLELFRPGFDLAREEAARQAAGVPNVVRPADLYPDALPCLQALRQRGYRLGLAGNQPPQTGEVLRTLGLPIDFLALSAGWGVEKPDPTFFAKVAKTAGFPPAEIAYVGDRLDNDILPSRAAGMISVFLQRGLWGTIQRQWPQAAEADLRIDSLAELPGALETYKQG